MNRSEGGSSLEDGQLELMVHRQDFYQVSLFVLLKPFLNFYHQTMSDGRLLWRR